MGLPPGVSVSGLGGLLSVPSFSQENCSMHTTTWDHCIIKLDPEIEPRSTNHKGQRDGSAHSSCVVQLADQGVPQRAGAWSLPSPPFPSLLSPPPHQLHPSVPLNWHFPGLSWFPGASWVLLKRALIVVCCPLSLHPDMVQNVLWWPHPNRLFRN